ncbi:MAG: hypothetical protein ACP5QK_10585 [Myxococcota bacterium]
MMRIQSLSLLFSSLLFLMMGCSVKPYLRSNAFSELGLNPQEVNRCIAMLEEDSVDYFLCEPESRIYKLKIIPADSKSGIMQIINEQNTKTDSFTEVIEGRILQMSIPINYSFLPAGGIKALKRGEKLYLIVRSVEGERRFVDALFIIDRYTGVSTRKRDRLR